MRKYWNRWNINCKNSHESVITRRVWAHCERFAKKCIDSIFWFVKSQWSKEISLDRIAKEMRYLQRDILGQRLPSKIGQCDNYVLQWWVELDDELSWLFTEGQIISECPYEKSVSSKLPTKIFLNFCPEIFCSFLGGAFW